MTPLSLRRMQTFMVVADMGSFRAASERLHLSPSAVSAHISQLEEEVGVALLNRTTRSVSLTDAGQTLLARFTDVFSNLEETLRSLREENELRRGSISIASSPAMLGNRLPKILARFRAKYPNISVFMQEDFAQVIYEWIARGEMDFAIGPRIHGLSALDFQVLVTNPYVVVASSEMFQTHSDEIRFSEAIQFPQITLPVEAASRQTLNVLFAQHGANLADHYSVKQLQTMFSMVESGLGVAITSVFSLPAIKSRGIRILRMIEPSLEQEVCLVTARGKRLSQPSVACIELIRQEIASISG